MWLQRLSRSGRGKVGLTLSPVSFERSLVLNPYYIVIDDRERSMNFLLISGVAFGLRSFHLRLDWKQTRIASKLYLSHASQVRTPQCEMCFSILLGRPSSKYQTSIDTY